MEKKITVYSTPLCTPCDQLKRFLKEAGVPFKIRDLMMDEEAADLIAQRGIRSTPVLEIDGEFFTGSQLIQENLINVLGL